MTDAELEMFIHDVFGEMDEFELIPPFEQTTGTV